MGAIISQGGQLLEVKSSTTSWLSWDAASRMVCSWDWEVMDCMSPSPPRRDMSLLTVADDDEVAIADVDSFDSVVVHAVTKTSLVCGQRLI
mmetsp:Transcript_30886/g.55970  ORF Transcript_30886/g.55970 Transcript_30886/m.55970 type:complete len:91 (-) Transcript_30886:182-454(-)